MNFKESKAIYLQIADRICDEILLGQYPEEERIPSCLLYTSYVDINICEEGTFSAADEEFLNRLKQIITEHLDNEQLGIPVICNKIGISRASLYNKLKALTDMGANDYITKIRMERAI